jgi:hypothetical protein
MKTHRNKRLYTKTQKGKAKVEENEGETSRRSEKEREGARKR